MDIFQNYFDAYENYFSTSGRTKRTPYWTFILINLLLTFLFRYAPAVVAGVFSLLIFIPTITITIRRLHDIGRSGWWVLLNLTFIGSIYVLYLTLKPSQPGANAYGI